MKSTAKIQLVLADFMLRSLFPTFFITCLSLAFPAAIVSSSAQTPPAEIRETLAGIDKAASQRQIDKVLQYYIPGFQNTDGLTIDKLRSGLEKMWSRYEQVSYQTNVNRWERQGSSYIVETTTLIKGLKAKDTSDFLLEARVVAEQTYSLIDNRWQVAAQRILQEKSILKSGEEPPNVELRLPIEIGFGRDYALDAIITKPLGNGFVLGATIDEEVNANNYLKERTVDLTPLRAGGIFQIGKAPYKEGDRWISVVLIQEGGITIASQRLKVSKKTIGEQYTPLPETGRVRRRLQPKMPSTI